MNSQSQPFNIAIAQAPVSTFSPDGTTIDINSTVTIKDIEGAVWAKLPVLNGALPQIGISRNGVRKAESIDLLTIKAGVVYNKDGPGWEKWVNGWVASAAP